MRVFCGMLDECDVNAFSLFINSSPLWKNNNIRREFLNNLSLELDRLHMNEMVTIPNHP
jgi:hypothetical protein